MSLNIRLKPKAYEDMAHIYQYSLKEFGPTKAGQYIEALDDTFRKLADNSAIGIDYSEIKPGIMACLSASHIVFFRRSKNHLTIIRVLYQSMDFIRHL